MQILDAAGKARFQEKTKQFQLKSNSQEKGQSLYYGIMTALGYAHNQVTFQELARKLPLAVLESEFSGENDQIRLEALLLGTAGLLPSQRPECEYSPFENYAYVDELERVWENTKH